MSRYKTNFSDFKSLQNYNRPVMKIPSISNDQVQLVPTWQKVNYRDPNYNSLNIADSYQSYASINSSYSDSVVNYIPRNCNPMQQQPTPGPMMTQAPLMNRRY